LSFFVVFGVNFIHIFQLHTENSADKQNGFDHAKAFDAVLKKLNEVLPCCPHLSSCVLACVPQLPMQIESRFEHTPDARESVPVTPSLKASINGATTPAAPSRTNSSGR
jgi:hypothetical protein